MSERARVEVVYRDTSEFIGECDLNSFFVQNININTNSVCSV